MIDNKELNKTIEQYALLKNRAFKRIVTEYKGTYDALYYTSFGLSAFQKSRLYRIAYKMFVKDVKRLKKIVKKLRQIEKRKTTEEEAQQIIGYIKDTYGDLFIKDEAVTDEKVTNADVILSDIDETSQKNTGDDVKNDG